MGILRSWDSKLLELTNSRMGRVSHIAPAIAIPVALTAVGLAVGEPLIGLFALSTSLLYWCLVGLIIILRGR